MRLVRKSKDEKQLVLPFHPGLPWLAADKVVALNVPVRDFSFCLFKDIMFWFSSYFKIKPLVATSSLSTGCMFGTVGKFSSS